MRINEPLERILRLKSSINFYYIRWTNAHDEINRFTIIQLNNIKFEKKRLLLI